MWDLYYMHIYYHAITVHLVVAPPGELRVNAGVVWLAGNTVWSTPECIRAWGEVLTTMCYTNWHLPLPFREQNLIAMAVHNTYVQFESRHIGDIDCFPVLLFRYGAAVYWTATLLVLALPWSVHNRAARQSWSVIFQHCVHCRWFCDCWAKLYIFTASD